MRLFLHASLSHTNPKGVGLHINGIANITIDISDNKNYILAKQLFIFYCSYLISPPTHILTGAMGIFKLYCNLKPKSASFCYFCMSPLPRPPSGSGDALNCYQYCHILFYLHGKLGFSTNIIISIIFTSLQSPPLGTLGVYINNIGRVSAHTCHPKIDISGP